MRADLRPQKPCCERYAFSNQIRLTLGEFELADGESYATGSAKAMLAGGMFQMSRVQSSSRNE